MADAIRARYAPGRADPAANRLRAEHRRERQKREANRPTGTEVDQTSRKLKEMAAELKAQQEQIRRATPTVAAVSGRTGAATLTTSWRTLVTLPARRDTSYGKTRAMVNVSVSCSRSGDGLAILDCSIGGTTVASFPGATLPGDPFGGTASTIITADTQVVVRGKSTVPGYSDIGDTKVTVTVMSIA